MLGGIPTGIVSVDLTSLRGENGEPLGQIGGLDALGGISGILGGFG